MSGASLHQRGTCFDKLSMRTFLECISAEGSKMLPHAELVEARTAAPQASDEDAVAQIVELARRAANLEGEVFPAASLQREPLRIVRYQTLQCLFERLR